MSEKIVVMKISGMHCDGCASSIKEVLAKSEGVIEASISFEKKQATVKFDDAKVSHEKLKKIIKDTGFVVV